MGSLNLFIRTKAPVKWCLVTGDWVTVVVSVPYRDRMGHRWEGREEAGCENIRFLHCSGQVSNDLESYSHNTLCIRSSTFASELLTHSLLLWKKTRTQTAWPLPSIQGLLQAFETKMLTKNTLLLSLPQGSAWNYINSNEDFGKTSFFLVSTFGLLLFFNDSSHCCPNCQRESHLFFSPFEEEKLCKSPNWAWTYWLNDKISHCSLGSGCGWTNKSQVKLPVWITHFRNFFQKPLKLKVFGVKKNNN